MSKKLSEMTLEELWQLFPIYLTEPNENYRAWYAEEAAEINSLLPEGLIKAMHHVGSTAIKGIWAKPIVDILIETCDYESMDEICRMLSANGWIFMSRHNGRMSLNKGYTDKGFAEKVFHLHLRLTDDRDEVYFRDYLNAHPEIAKEYEKLKLMLWKRYEHDRDGYTAAKTDFVRYHTARAKTSFIFMDNDKFDVYAEKLFSILHENMRSIVPPENDHEAGFNEWHAAVSGGLKRPERRIVLIYFGDVLAGFFQYYANESTFMMEEIQLLPDYRKNYGIFRSLYSWLLPQLPQNISVAKAFAHRANTVSDGILKHMGLMPVSEEDQFIAYSGEMNDLLRRYAKIAGS